MQTPPQARRTPRAIVLLFTTLALYTFADLGSKEWALDQLSRERTGEQPPVCEPDARGQTHMQRVPLGARPLIEGVLQLSYAENCGAAWSMLRDAPGWLRIVLFGATTVGALVVLMTLFFRGAGGPMFAASVPLVLSGAIGNFCDRLRHGFVVDFLLVDPRLFRYPVFNVADIAIAIGVGLMLLESFRKPDEAVSATKHQASSDRRPSRSAGGDGGGTL